LYFLYSILLLIGVVALLPRFLFDAARHGKYAAGFWERLGIVPPVNGKNVVWLHCVSVGETQAARAVATQLLARFPSITLVVSTTTLTGQRVAREAFGKIAESVFYFPFDWAWTVRRTLRRVNPALVLIMETELWPRFLRECRKSEVAVALVNGRISARSFRNYRRLGNFISRVMNDLSLAAMQTETDAARIEQLGFQRERIVVSGNVKFDIDAEAFDKRLSEELKLRFDLVNQYRPLIVAASTHAPEEKILLEAFQYLDADLKQHASGSNDKNFAPRLLLAPRHPERFAEIASLIADSNFRFARRSSIADKTDSQCDIILLDSIGELRAIYPHASMVFVGGSITPRGGHNVIEPAAAGCCILTGAHTENFSQIVSTFLDAKAIIQFPPLTPETGAPFIARIFKDLLFDEERRLMLGANARTVIADNRGATARTIEALTPLLNSSLHRQNL
jgi:3-deoxy-D-manno-octulosonic-acid transferase